MNLKKVDFNPNSIEITIVDVVNLSKVKMWLIVYCENIHLFYPED